MSQNELGGTYAQPAVLPEHIRRLGQHSPSIKEAGNVGALAGALLALTGCGNGSESAAPDTGYTSGADGLVSSISDERFYLEGKKIRLDSAGGSGFMYIENGYLSVCKSDSNCASPIALNEIDKSAPLCRGTDINEGLNSIGFWVMICSGTEPAPLKEISSQGYKSSETIPAGTPWVLVENFRSGVLARYRFSVDLADISRQAKEGDDEGTANLAVQQPSKCELIAQGEAETRRACDSGNFSACRDIAGWVANKVMEGCTSGDSSSMQQAEEGVSQVVAPDTQAQPSVAAISESQEQHLNEEVAHPAAETAPVVEGGATDVTVRSMTPPRYPPAAARAGVYGEVNLVIAVDASGNVTDVAVEKSSRNRDLDRAAMEAARKWTFNPAKASDGQAMAGKIRVPVTFGPGSDDGEPSVGVLGQEGATSTTP